MFATLVQLSKVRSIAYQALAAAASILAVVGRPAAKAVATNLAAFSLSTDKNTLTMTAVGALAVQDGVTMAVGDTLFLPQGTLTTAVVTAAQSGPWVISSLGAAGAQVVMVRPSYFRAGATVQPETEYKIAAGGTRYASTVWFIDNATPVVVGTTTTHGFYPRQITVPYTFGAAAITNIPIRSATGTGFQVIRLTNHGVLTATVQNVASAINADARFGTASFLPIPVTSAGATNAANDVSDALVTVFN